jgi:pilus assembly protein Flp/PilA
MMRFLRDESGATAIEYAFIAMLISLLVIAGASGAGSKLGNHFNNVKNNLN